MDFLTITLFGMDKKSPTNDLEWTYNTSSEGPMNLENIPVGTYNEFAVKALPIICENFGNEDQ